MGNTVPEAQNVPKGLEHLSKTSLSHFNTVEASSVPSFLCNFKRYFVTIEASV